MSGFRNKEFEEDPFDKEIRNIYDDIDEQMKDWKDDNGLSYESYGEEPYLWKDDIEDILSELGIDPDFEVPLFPKEQLDRIEEYYGSQSKAINDDNMYEEFDPLPLYSAGVGSAKKELYKLGYAVGSEEHIGRYYKLLPLINFSRGYWLSKFERAVKDDNDNMILEVSREMKIVNPKTAEKELTSIVNRCFTDVVNLDDPNEKKEEDYYLK